MKIDKGLLVTFLFLDYLDTEIYNQNNEYLEMIASASNFFIWAPDSEGYIAPADPAKTEDWLDAYKMSGIEIKEEFNSIEIFKIMLSYLKFHEKEFNFELKEVIALLENMLLHPDNHKDLWEIWNKATIEAKKKKYKIIPFEKIPKIKYMVDRYTNILEIIDETPLHISALKGDIELTDSLLREGLDINARDKKLWTPLYWSIAFGEKDMVKHLIEKGADINIEDEHKKTPLHAAYSRNNKELVDMLLKKGANPS